jgi:hypothetical protein
MCVGVGYESAREQVLRDFFTRLRRDDDRDRIEQDRRRGRERLGRLDPAPVLALDAADRGGD